MKKFLPFLNPVKWYHAYRFAKQNTRFDKSTFDLELYLYSKILSNKMLHYGYFENTDIKPEDISFKIFEDAQLKYADNILSHIKNTKDTILDVGCGMGGLAEIMHSQGQNIECLTPNKNQIDFIKKEMPFLTTYKAKFEDFNSTKSYGTIINSESLQYIEMHLAIAKCNELLKKDGQWIISDYFSINKEEEGQKPHHLSTFLNQVQEQGWEVSFQKDITPHILPTLSYLDMYVKRFLNPLKHYGFEKLRFKKPKLYYMSNSLRGSINDKINKETRTVDPEVFQKERKYMFLVLIKS